MKVKLTQLKEKKKEEEEQKKKLDEQMRKLEKDKKHKESEQRKQQDKEVKNKIQEYEKRKAEETRKEKEEKEKQEREKKILAGKRFKEFNSQQVKEIYDDFAKKKSEKQKEEEEKKKKEELEKQKLQRLHLKIFDDIKQIKEAEQISHEKIMGLHNSADVQAIYEKSRFKLSVLFELLFNFTFKDISYMHEGNELPLRTMNWFCQHFGLYPEIIKSIDIGLIFRSVTKHKEKHPPSLTYSEFLIFLTRLAIKGKNVFNKFAEHMHAG